jgi:type IV pilus assembly protein PilQ
MRISMQGRTLALLLPLTAGCLAALFSFYQVWGQDQARPLVQQGAASHAADSNNTPEQPRYFIPESSDESARLDLRKFSVQSLAPAVQSSSSRGAVRAIASTPLEATPRHVEPATAPLPDAYPRREGVVRAAAEEPLPFQLPQSQPQLLPEPPEKPTIQSEKPLIQSRGAESADVPRTSGNGPLRVPLAGSSSNAIEMDIDAGLVTIVARDASLNEVLSVLARQQGLNVIASEDIKGHISITLNKVPIAAALDNILAVGGYTACRQDNILLITGIGAERKVLSSAQGRVVQVFRLNYTSASDVNVIVKGLLSPAGQSFISQTKDSDTRKTQEVLVVEDLPWNIERLTKTIEELDVPPKQVLIEAHILSVDLKKDFRWGVNLEGLLQAQAAGSARTNGFANAAAFAARSASEAVFFNLAAHDLTMLIEALTTTADAKTLASPKVFVVNGQQARIQIGGQLGFKVVTTTQTSTMESVNFLNVGIILNVTPQITPDNQVLMKVKPEVSTGKINPETGLPDSQTTQVETSVLLPDGRGIVIGGLIQEEDTTNEEKVPVLGDLWLVGWMFQHRAVKRTRSEVIISLIPHVVPYQCSVQEREQQEYCRSATPLLDAPLKKSPRTYEPILPDTTVFPSPFRRKLNSEISESYKPVGSFWDTQAEPTPRAAGFGNLSEPIPPKPSPFAPLTESRK